MPYYGKATAILLFAFILLSTATAKAEDIFADLTDLKQVESTYISGRFAHNQKTWQSHSGMRAVNLSDGFSSLYTYRCYSQESVDKARSILKAYLRKHPEMEVVMRTKELAGEYVIYEQFNSDDKLMKMIIWNGEAPNLCEIVVVDWKDGYVRKTSQNAYDIYNFPEAYGIDYSGVIDFSALSDLSGLSQLSQLSQLSELSQLKNLDQLKQLKQLDLFNRPEGVRIETSEGGDIVITVED